MPTDQILEAVEAAAVRAAADIRRLSTREQVEGYLRDNDKALTVPVLKRLAELLGPTVAGGATRKADLARDIVEGTVGFRERSAAMSGGAWDDAPPAGTPPEPGIVWRNPNNRQPVALADVEKAFAEAAGQAADNRRGPDWAYGDEPNHAGLADPLAPDPGRPHLTAAEARRRDGGQCIWVVESGMHPTIRYCPKPHDPDNDDADYCKEHEAEARSDDDEAAYHHYAEPGGPDYTAWAADNLPDPDTDWAQSAPVITDGGTTPMAGAASLEIALASAAELRRVADEFAAAGEKAGADLAGAGLPPEDITDASAIADAGHTMAGSAQAVFDGLVARHIPIRDAIIAAGGAASSTSWYGVAL